MPQTRIPSLDEILGTSGSAASTRVQGEGPAGRLPLTEQMLIEEPSGNLFGLTQNVGMGWDPASAFGMCVDASSVCKECASPLAASIHTTKMPSYL